MNANRKSRPLIPSPWPASHFIGEEEIQAVSEVLCNRSPSRFIGPNIQGFAKKLEAWYRNYLQRNTVAVASGTLALEICLRALNIGPGDEVLVPGYAWASCYSAVVRSGAIPRLVEIDETLGMDPVDLEKKIGLPTRAVMLVHMNGGCGRVKHVVDLCKEHELLLIEDVCQANGGKFEGHPLGSIGDAAVFSFQMNKTITSGEGGLIAFKGESSWRRAWVQHNHGYQHELPNGPDSYSSIESSWGVGARMNELTAAMVLTQTTKIERIVFEMKRRQRYLYEQLRRLPDVQFRPGTATENDIGSCLVLIWPDKARCETVVQETREMGVCTASGFGNLALTETGLHLYYNNLSLVNRRPLHPSGRPWNDPLNGFASEYRYAKGSLPQTDELLERTQLLYVSPAMEDEELQRTVDIFYEQMT